MSLRKRDERETRSVKPEASGYNSLIRVAPNYSLIAPSYLFEWTFIL